jgi:hypothetical protein
MEVWALQVLEAPTVELTSATISAAGNTPAVHELPLNGRS